MFEERNNFLMRLKVNFQALICFCQNQKNLKTLNDLEFLLNERWPAIFSSLTDYPLNEKEKNILLNFIKKIENLNKKVGYKLSFFNDFQKYMKESIEK